MADKLVNGPSTDGGKARIPALKTKSRDERDVMIRDNTAKGKLLYQAFFPVSDKGNPVATAPDYPPPACEFEEVTDMQIHRTILKLSPYKAPGPSGIPNAVLTNCRELLVPYLGPIYHATFKLVTYPSDWKVSSTITLRKPGKPNYSLTKVY